MLVCLCACGRAQTDQDEITDEDEFINSFSYEENALPAPMTVSTSQYSDGQSLYFCGMDIAGNKFIDDEAPIITVKGAGHNRYYFKLFPALTPRENFPPPLAGRKVPGAGGI